MLVRSLELIARAQIDPATDEFKLNEQLARYIKKANFQIIQNEGEEEGLDFLPSYDGHQYPAFDDDDEPLESNPTRPDFVWEWQDKTASTEDEMTRELVIECKRLGDTRGTRFNRHYVYNGVARFVEPSHKYGETAPRGTMVGYLGDERHTVLAAVQTHLTCKGIANLTVITLDDEVGRLTQALTRPFGSPDYELLHFWVDLAVLDAGLAADPSADATSMRDPASPTVDDQPPC